MASKYLNLSTDDTLGGNTPSDYLAASQKAIKTYVDNNSGGGGGLAYTAACPAITIMDGVATWAVTHNLGTQTIITQLYSSSGAKIEHNVLITSNNAITITFKASSNVSAGDYTIVVMAGGASSTNTLYDGQWVYNYSVLADEVTYNKTSNIEYNLSNYLPNDGADYNVLFEILSKSSSSGYISIPIRTDMFAPSGAIRCANIHNLGWYDFEQTEHIWIPVGAARKITIVGVSWLGDTQYNLTALGYRRMGTNV